MPNIKTITLDGTEKAVKFPQSYPHYIITNLGDNEIYASADSGIAPDADEVCTVPAGTETYVTPKQGDTVYLFGTGRVQIRGWEYAVPPSPSFKRVQKGGGGAYEFGKKFSSHNLLADVGTNTDICTKTQNGENVTYTIAANKAAAWYYITTLITVKRGKMYKLTVNKFDGYGRLAISSYDNGASNPYGDRYISHFNLNTAGNFTDDNNLISADDTKPKYFFVVNSDSSEYVNIGIWFCADKNLDGINGTEAHSFDIGLYEEISVGENAGGSIPSLSLRGITGYFDMSTTDIENKKWHNRIDGYNDIDLPNGFSKTNEAIILNSSQYGIFSTELPSTVYAVFKAPFAQSNIWTPVVTKKLSYGAQKCGFDLYIHNKNITGTAIASDIGSNISAVENYHCACITSINDNSFLLYVDGVLQGIAQYSTGYYTGEFLINKVQRGSSSPDASGEIYYSSLLFGTEYHNNVEIAENSKFLLNHI